MPARGALPPPPPLNPGDLVTARQTALPKVPAKWDLAEILVRYEGSLFADLLTGLIDSTKGTFVISKSPDN